jgi:phosphoglycerate kinase
MSVVQDVEFLLPVDVVCTHDLDSNDVCCIRPLNSSCCTCKVPCVPNDAFGADFGPKTQKLFAAAIKGSGTVFWNGPMGRFEMPAFAECTEAVARAVAEATSAGATTIIGGVQPAYCFNFKPYRTLFCWAGFPQVLLQPGQWALEAVS